tara:strand:- start:198 stop:719 length:522 start_codon:yes stop_codon:yes gene_type:complete
MFGIKGSGDALASEFAKILSNTTGNSPLSKVAMQDSDLIDDADTGEVDLSEDQSSESSDLVDESPESFLMDHDEDKVDDKTGLDEAIDSCAGEENALIKGLGKIAADLRGKDEHFAADMVEATAISIGEDLRKEASKKTFVIEGLKKIARSLDSSGDVFAGDVVRTTIRNISI